MQIYGTAIKSRVIDTLSILYNKICRTPELLYNYIRLIT